MVGGDGTPLAVTRLAPLAATLGFGGFPRPVSPDGRSPFAYDPQQVDRVSPWKAHAGTYTAFGDVSEPLRATDDRFVTTRNGDEIEVAFLAPAAPAPGRRRSWLLYAAGFGKDMDPNSAASDTLAPVPFHGMPHYPYGDGVVPPPETVDVGGRYVPPSDRGWHGAVPQALVAR
jgi:hypothetical protein